MKYLYTISLCLIFIFLGNISITNAQTCGGTSCPSPKVCVNVDGATKCLDNKANSSGICRGDSSINCGTNQACVESEEDGIVCATKVALTSADQQNAAVTTGVGTNPTGLLQGLQQFQGANSGLNTGGTLIGYIANIIRWILGILGTVFFVIVVLQGYIYMTAGGDSSKTASAAGAIGNAVVGLLIIMGAFLITNFVTSGLINSGGGSTTTPTEQSQENNNRNNNNRNNNRNNNNRSGND